MKTNIFLFIALIGLFSACTKEDNNPPIEVQTFEVKANSSSVWKYFSFEKNDTVSIIDPLTSTDWDLAFQRYRIKTNGGLSGNGLGSAANSYQKGQAGFDALTAVSDTASFTVDTSIQIAVQQGYSNYILNPELYSWFAIELAAQGTQIVPTDFIYVVKTANGNFAKVWIKSYYSATNTSGFVTFQYKYQPNGSKLFE